MELQPFPRKWEKLFPCKAHWTKNHQTVRRRQRERVKRKRLRVPWLWDTEPYNATAIWLERVAWLSVSSAYVFFWGDRTPWVFGLRVSWPRTEIIGHGFLASRILGRVSYPFLTRPFFTVRFPCDNMSNWHGTRNAVNISLPLRVGVVAEKSFAVRVSWKIKNCVGEK